MSKINRGPGKKKDKFNMCGRKRKFKSSEASRFGHKWGQRKYECPVCGHWHLTKGDRYEKKHKKK